MKAHDKRKSINKVLTLLFMYLFMEGLLTGWLYLNEHPVNRILGNIFVTTVLFGMIAFYIGSSDFEQDRIYKTGVDFGITFLLVLLSFFLPDYSKPIWAISIVFTFSTGLLGGICFQILFVIISIFLFDLSIDIVILYLITGISLVLLSPYMKTKKLTGMCFLTMIGVHITTLSGLILFFEKEFQIVDLKQIVVGIIIGILLMILSLWKWNDHKLARKRLEDKLILVTNKEYSLMKEMKEKSFKMYEHGVKVGELSEAMAKIIGADPLLVRAGGYYYKVGKLLGKDYSLYGAKIGREYKLPAKVITIISEHYGKGAHPSTIESGIVMLADTVVSSFEYIHSKNLNMEFNNKKAMEQILISRVEKGLLDSAGINIRQYEALKTFLLQEGSKL